jgi:hypothetical protein
MVPLRYDASPATAYRSQGIGCRAAEPIGENIGSPLKIEPKTRIFISYSRTWTSRWRRLLSYERPCCSCMIVDVPTA